MEKVALLPSSPEVLSVENIAKVRNRLAALEALTPAMESCLDHALLRFSREGSCLQENASLVIRCEEQQLQFVSGKGESSLEVTFLQGDPDYKVQLPRFSEAVEKSPCGRLLLSAQNLEKIVSEMISWREMTKDLKACLNHAQSHFSQEPIRIQRNCTMLIQQDGRTLELTTGKGENCITVYRTPDRTIHYDIELSTFVDHFVRAVTPSAW